MNWDDIEIENGDLIVCQTPLILEEDNLSEHSSTSNTTIDIDDIIENNYRDNEQLLIDLGHPRLIDNPKNVGCVSDLPPSNRINTTSSEESLTSAERRRRQEQQQSDWDTQSNTATPTPTESSVVRPVRPVVVVSPSAQKNKIDKYLDFRHNREGLINVLNLSPISVGSLPNVTTKDHVVNNFIIKGAKIFLPKNVCINRYTPEKNLPFIKCVCNAGILQETKFKPKYTIALFAVPKSDPRNPRITMDFKPFTKLTKSQFSDSLILINW